MSKDARDTSVKSQWVTSLVSIAIIAAFTLILWNSDDAKVPAQNASVDGIPPSGVVADQFYQCGRMVSLPGLQKELADLIVQHNVVLMDTGLKASHAEGEIRGVVIEARDCQGASLKDLKISEDFWLTIARPFDEIPRQYVRR